MSKSHDIEQEGSPVKRKHETGEREIGKKPRTSSFDTSESSFATSALPIDHPAAGAATPHTITTLPSEAILPTEVASVTNDPYSNILSKYSALPAVRDYQQIRLREQALGFHLLHFLAMHKPEQTQTYQQIISELKELEGDEFNIDVQQYQRGVTPLHVAAEAGNDLMVSLLIKHGADLNKSYELAGRTRYEFYRNNDSIGTGLQTCFEDKYEMTPFWFAALKYEAQLKSQLPTRIEEYENILTLFISREAYNDTRTKIIKNYPGVQGFISRAKVSTIPTIRTIQAVAMLTDKNISTVPCLTDISTDGGDLDAGITEYGALALAQDNNERLITWLQRAGNDTIFDSGISALNFAIVSNKPESVEQILEARPDLLDQLDGNGVSPIAMSINCRNALIFKRLIEYGADLNIRTNVLDMTPLQFAVMSYSTNKQEKLNLVQTVCIAMLTSANLFMQTNNRGETILHTLAQYDNATSNEDAAIDTSGTNSALVVRTSYQPYSLTKYIMTKAYESNALTDLLGASTKSGDSALQLAVRFNNPALCDSFITLLEQEWSQICSSQELRDIMTSIISILTREKNSIEDTYTKVITSFEQRIKTISSFALPENIAKVMNFPLVQKAQFLKENLAISNEFIPNQNTHEFTELRAKIENLTSSWTNKISLILDRPDSTGDLLIHVAVRMGRCNIAQILINKVDAHYATRLNQFNQYPFQLIDPKDMQDLLPKLLNKDLMTTILATGDIFPFTDLLSRLNSLRKDALVYFLNTYVDYCATQTLVQKMALSSLTREITKITDRERSTIPVSTLVNIRGIPMEPPNISMSR